VAELPEPDFCDGELAAAAAILWKQPGTAVMSLADDGSEAFRLGESLLSRLALEDSDKFTHPAQHLRDLLTRRQLIGLEAKAARLQKALDARPGGDDEMTLLKQKAELKTAIQHLKQA
jgi:hypothetical protein